MKVDHCSALFTLSYKLYEGVNLAYQKIRKLGAFGQKLGGSHSPFYCNFYEYWANLTIILKQCLLHEYELTKLYNFNQ